MTNHSPRIAALPISPTNGDEAAYPTPIANFTKGLPHNALGEGDRTAYAALRAPLTTGQATAFEALPLGGQLPFVNPQAAYAFALEDLPRITSRSQPLRLS